MRTSDCMSDTSPTGPRATRANFCAAFSAMSPLLDQLRQFQFHAAALAESAFAGSAFAGSADILSAMSAKRENARAYGAFADTMSALPAALSLRTWKLET